MEGTLFANGMNVSLPHYFGGGAVHPGDRVRYKDDSGNVVFVTDGELGEFAPGFTDYRGYEPGIMIMSDAGELLFIVEPNEQLELLRSHEGQGIQLA